MSPLQDVSDIFLTVMYATRPFNLKILSNFSSKSWPMTYLKSMHAENKSINRKRAYMPHRADLMKCITVRSTANISDNEEKQMKLPTVTIFIYRLAPGKTFQTRKPHTYSRTRL